MKVKVGPASAITPGDVHCVPLGEDEFGLPREALVLRLEDGSLRAYVNVCKHLPIPLDSGAREFLDDGKTHLVCNTHGATFRVGDGMCVEGPCRGLPLDPVALSTEDGVVYVEMPDSD